MGRTILSFRIASEIEIRRRRSFRAALEKERER
jgi:hypothetical protein